MRVTTLNIKGRRPIMGPRKFTRDATAGEELGGIGFRQEINPPHYKRLLERLAHKRGKAVVGVESPVPITVATGPRRIVEDYRVKTHGGKALASPARWLNVALTEPRGRRQPNVTGDALVSSHYVSAAWNNAPRPNKAWRRRAWDKHHDRLRAEVLDLLALGYHVHIGADFNRRIDELPEIHPDAVIVNAATIDALIVIPQPGYRVEVADRVVIPQRRLGTDHPLVAARYYLRPDHRVTP